MCRGRGSDGAAQRERWRSFTNTVTLSCDCLTVSFVPHQTSGGDSVRMTANACDSSPMVDARDLSDLNMAVGPQMASPFASPVPSPPLGSPRGSDTHMPHTHTQSETELINGETEAKTQAEARQTAQMPATAEAQTQSQTQTQTQTQTQAPEHARVSSSSSRSSLLSAALAGLSSPVCVPLPSSSLSASSVSVPHRSPPSPRQPPSPSSLSQTPSQVSSLFSFLCRFFHSLLVPLS